MITELVAKPTRITEKEQERVLLYINNLSASSIQSRELEVKCWKYFNNDVDDSQFEYLTKIGEFELPSRVRHIPMQRHLIDLLISQQSIRPFNFSIVGIDKRSSENRYNNKIIETMSEYKNSVRQASMEISMKKQELEGQLQSITQMMQTEPKSQEEALQIQKAKQQFPQISMQINQVISQFQDAQVISDDKLMELDRKLKYKTFQIDEEYAQHVMYDLRQKLNIERESTRNFKYKVVTGSEYYYVDYFEGHRHPIFESYDVGKVRYPKIDNVKEVQNGPWVSLVDSISFEQVQTVYGEEIIRKYGAQKLNEIGQLYGSNNMSSSFISMPDNTAMYYPQNDTSMGIEDWRNNIQRNRIFFKIPRRVRIKLSENKYVQGKYFRHFIDSEKILIDQDDYQYRDGFYISKDKKKRYAAKQVDKYSTKNNDKIETRIITDVYEGTILTPGIVVGLRKKKFVVYDIDNYTVAKLPVVGPTHSSIAEKPYSLVSSTFELQDTYNLLYYYQDLMMALAGTRGNIIDVSQKPDSMEMPEWEYQMKLGRLYIQTMGADGRAIRNASFNQWQSYDNSLSPSIQYIGNMIAQVEDTMGNIIGVTRPRQGQVVSTDQVGTFNAANQQASLITEIIYSDHDEIERQAVSQLLNLACRYVYNKETVISYSTSDMGIESIRIPANMFTESFFDTIVAKNSEEANSLKEIKQIAMQNHAKGLMSFQEFTELYSTNILTDLRSKAEYFAKKAQELQAMNFQNEQAAKIEYEKQKASFNNEYKMYADKLNNEIEGMKLKLEESKLRFEMQKHQTEIEFKYAQDKNKNKTAMAGIESERDIEGAYLINQDDHATKDEKLRAYEIELESIRMKIEALRDKEDSDRSHVENMTKIHTDHAVKMKSKEHIKD